MMMMSRGRRGKCRISGLTSGSRLVVDVDATFGVEKRRISYKWVRRRSIRGKSAGT